MNRKEKIKLLTQIATGTLSPKALLPQQTEIWHTISFPKEGKYEWCGYYEYEERRLSAEQFNDYRENNPQIWPLVIHVYETGTPIFHSEAEVIEYWNNKSR